MAEKKWCEEEKGGFRLIINDGGKTLGVSPEGGVIEQDGFAFKDLDKSGVMEPYKDWRLTPGVRAKDLVSRMDLDSKLGLSLHDGMFTIMRMTEETLNSNPFLKAKFALSGKSLEDVGDADPAELTDRYKEQVLKEKMRSWLVGAIDGPEYAARFNNNVQALAESDAFGIPVMISTNPRAFKDAHSDTAQRDVTTFPSNLGMAAT
ncbi:MAG: beta-glucosidase, partial [Lachnospiraceae bacterium]|nr:beta-glucosidase [Lachnospiraceae bacterium]